MYAPIAIFVYNRRKHLENLIESLKGNMLCKESIIFIFSDGYKGEKDKYEVEKVREYIHSLRDGEWFKKLVIIESPKNKGLPKSIISGVTKVINKYGKVIVLEDDLVISNYFLKFMNQALDYYKDNKKIWSISGFTRDIPYLHTIDYDIYFSKRAQSWGWATWGDRWNKVDWKVKEYRKFKIDFKRRREFNAGGKDMSSMLDRQQCGVIHSWAIRFCFAQYLDNSFTVQPRITLVQNGGQDGSGTHCNVLVEFAEFSKQQEWKFREVCSDKTINMELKRTRKKIPYWKLMGSFILFVILKGRLYIRKI